MQSSLIGKIEKARRYAEEPDRFSVTEITCQIRGDNSTHTTRLQDDTWRCDCLFFADYDTCSHTMALQRLLGELAPMAVQTAPASS